MESEDRTLICDLIVKAYEHHKIHARFEETQRGWMVAAYFTFTGLVYAGVIWKVPLDVSGLPESFTSFWIVALFSHLVVGMLIMISVAKVSGEFSRHFSRAEKILSDVKTLCDSDESLKRAFRNVSLETAAKKEGGKVKRKWIPLFSNTAVHNYMFAFLTAIDVYLLLVGPLEQPRISILPLMVAVIWFVIASVLLYKYVGWIEATGTSSSPAG